MLQHTTKLRVRYDECDPMGLVHHSNYLRYFEIGRTELLRASGGRYRDMEDAGQLVVVARVDARYLLPARYDEVLEVSTRIAKVTGAKIIHEYEIRRGDVILVKANVTLAVIDREGRLQPVPKSLIQQYESDEKLAEAVGRGVA
ncbi:MAG: thioesterase family protein [Planctomycetota bacterium]